jgi:hypothetical protein
MLTGSTNEKVARTYALAAAAVGWMTLLVQLYLTTGTVFAQEGSLFDGLVVFLGYFTILTNVLVAVTLTAAAIQDRDGWSHRPAVAGGVATAIALVGIVYSLLLRQTWSPQGLALVADACLHDVIPVAFIIYWVLFVPHRSLRWRDPFVWLAYPLAYVVVTVLRGILTGRYPYPFADVNALGWTQVAINTAAVLAGFLLIGFVFVIVDQVLPGSVTSAEGTS